MNTHTKRLIEILKLRPDLHIFKNHNTFYFSHLVNGLIKDYNNNGMHIDSLFVDYNIVNKEINSL